MARLTSLFALLALLALFVAAPALAQDAPMTFFITSAGPGNGADLGGLEGADAHCQQLADAVGAGDRTWHAYLSTMGSEDHAAVSARDRIGSGPWHNQKGVMVASDVDRLHGDDNNLTKETQLTENGDMVNGRGDSPNMHDIFVSPAPVLHIRPVTSGFMVN